MGGPVGTELERPCGTSPSSSSMVTERECRRYNEKLVRIDHDLYTGRLQAESIGVKRLMIYFIRFYAVP